MNFSTDTLRFHGVNPVPLVEFLNIVLASSEFPCARIHGIDRFVNPRFGFNSSINVRMCDIMCDMLGHVAEARGAWARRGVPVMDTWPLPAGGFLKTVL